MSRLHKFETVRADTHGRAMLERVSVPGGWIYLVYREPGSNEYAGCAFVPHEERRPRGRENPYEGMPR